MSELVLKLEGVGKTYSQGSVSTRILHDVNLELYSGEVVSLVGASGCGKSTLLHIAGLMDAATEGKIVISGNECDASNDDLTTTLRRDNIGFVYQFHHLLAEFTAIENAMMPLLIQGESDKVAREKASELLDLMSLSHRKNNLPSELSGGEQQRVAIARSMVHKPKLILADEPTGNLDPEISAFVFDEFVKIARTQNVALLIVTHNLAIAKKTDRILTIRNGMVQELNEK